MLLGIPPLGAIPLSCTELGPTDWTCIHDSAPTTLMLGAGDPDPEIVVDREAPRATVSVAAAFSLGAVPTAMRSGSVSTTPTPLVASTVTG